MHTCWHAVARIAKTHGRKGELVAEPLCGCPSVLCAGMLVAIVPPELRVERYRKLTGVAQDTRGQLVKLQGVNELGVAKKLVGRTILVRETDLPAGFLRHAPAKLIGRGVRDIKAGELGHIREVLVGRGNDVWTVEGPAGEVYVPVVDAFIRSWPEEGDIVVCLPDGCLPEG